MEVGQAGHSLECVSLLRNWSGGRMVMRRIANPCPRQCRFESGPDLHYWCFSSVGKSIPLITVRSLVQFQEALPSQAYRISKVRRPAPKDQAIERFETFFVGSSPTRSKIYGPIVYTGIRISGFHPEEVGSIPTGATKVYTADADCITHYRICIHGKVNACLRIGIDFQAVYYCPIVYLVGRRVLSAKSLVRTQVGHPKTSGWCSGRQSVKLLSLNKIGWFLEWFKSSTTYQVQVADVVLAPG
jgi:hypothetical protein